MKKNNDNEICGIYCLFNFIYKKFNITTCNSMKNLSPLIHIHNKLRNAVLLSGILSLSAYAVQAQSPLDVQSFKGTNDNTTELGFDGVVTPILAGSTAGTGWTNDGSPLFDISNPGSGAWGVSRATEGVLFRTRYTTASSRGNYIQFKVGAWGKVNNEGLDLADDIKVYVSIDGGTNLYYVLQITGQNNGGSYWDFSSGTPPQRVVTFNTSNIPDVVTPPNGNGNHTGQGYSNYRINLPDGALNIRLGIVATNDNLNELWTIDEVSIGNSTNAPLPVELKSFTAEAATKGTQLKWATASEKNNAAFEIQRSSTPSEFKTIGRVAGQGTSSQSHSYEWLDAQPLGGLSYYRLRQIDTDGTESFSLVVTVQHKEGMAGAFFPNPTTGLVTLNAALGTVKYRVLNTLGQTVLTGEAQGGNTVDMQSLRTGAYFLELQSASGRTVQRFMREL
ncbi:T9SS type A sorting domain-containing protein [Hymenobacter sp. BT186]|uniref:T9SS type A sorting domain-containing protein n=1 Tax=Hymenobacter telluris TaxID=2816474 RepID=A0A939EYL3_9BACT|nr:T9SS type A sorting domain-containing protein [Hymenobacter telluris]MBO0359584.1 T9SS type A sorting domain-containing protein [Hymenobacter telluris]MBW3375611.1 T9SS type A sorting domain-containing protein [Hymenobacter norwichensis]